MINDDCREYLAIIFYFSSVPKKCATHHVVALKLETQTTNSLLVHEGRKTLMELVNICLN